MIHLDSGKIRDAFWEFIQEDGFDFELGAVNSIVDENSNLDDTFSDTEQYVAYAKAFVIFADVLKQYAQHEVDVHEEESPQ